MLNNKITYLIDVRGYREAPSHFFYPAEHFSVGAGGCRESVVRKQTCAGSVAKRCGHSPYTIPNILAFDFSVLFVGYSLIENISLTFFVAQRTKRPARE